MCTSGFCIPVWIRYNLCASRRCCVTFSFACVFFIDVRNVMKNLLISYGRIRWFWSSFGCPKWSYLLKWRFLRVPKLWHSGAGSSKLKDCCWSEILEECQFLEIPPFQWTWQFNWNLVYLVVRGLRFQSFGQLEIRHFIEYDFEDWCIHCILKNQHWHFSRRSTGALEYRNFGVSKHAFSMNMTSKTLKRYRKQDPWPPVQIVRGWEAQQPPSSPVSVQFCELWIPVIHCPWPLLKSQLAYFNKCGKRELRVCAYATNIVTAWAKSW